MQDHHPTKETDADTPDAPSAGAAKFQPAEAATGHASPTTAGEFDPDAFEAAAAQLRPSWDGLPVPEHVRHAVADNTGQVGAHQAAQPSPRHPVELARDPGTHQPAAAQAVVAPPPRTSGAAYAPMAPDDDGALDLTVAGLPHAAPRLWWIAAAAVVLIGTLGFALTGSSTPSARAPLASGPLASAPKRVAPVHTPSTVSGVRSPRTAPSTTAPAEIAPAQAPSAVDVPPPPMAATPAVPTAVPASTKPVVAEATRAPAPSAPTQQAARADLTRTPPASTPTTRTARPHSSRDTRSARAQTPAAPTRRVAPPSSLPRSTKIKRGVGFVSANPY